jgi:hypothetical protein
MVSGRCAVIGCLTSLLWLGCSTEDAGLFNFDGGGVVEQQGMTEPDAAASLDTRPKPDRAPDPSADGAADAPAAIDVAAAADLAPDKAPATDQPLGAACTKKSECASGFCADGVCCNVACDDGCNACTLARTGRTDGTCSWAKDTDGKMCGKACGVVSGDPAVVERVCAAGACLVPAAPKVIESCHDQNPCVVAFCDNNDARCVKTSCPQQGTCCCRENNGQQMCRKQDQCKGTCQ